MFIILLHFQEVLSNFKFWSESQSEFFWWKYSAFTGTFQCSCIKKKSAQSKSILLFWIRIRFLVFWIQIRFLVFWTRIRILVLGYVFVFWCFVSGFFLAFIWIFLLFSWIRILIFFALGQGFVVFFPYYDSFICSMVYLWSLAPFLAEEKQPRTAQHFMFLWIMLISQYIHTLNNHMIIYYQIRNI